jgi:hypothetical protein
VEPREEEEGKEVKITLLNKPRHKLKYGCLGT